MAGGTLIHLSTLSAMHVIAQGSKKQGTLLLGFSLAKKLLQGLQPVAAHADVSCGGAQPLQKGAT